MYYPGHESHDLISQKINNIYFTKQNLRIKKKMKLLIENVLRPERCFNILVLFQNFGFHYTCDGLLEPTISDKVVFCLIYL